MKYFAKSHEWIDVNGDIGTVGITEYAKEQLGDIVYVELPKLGQLVKAGDAVCVIESTKAASDVYTPASGTVVEVNTGSLPHAWLYKLKLSNTSELTSLHSQSEYDQRTKG